MFTTLTAFDEAPADDADITVRLGCRETGELPGDPAICVAVENPVGTVYRVFCTTSVVEAVRLFETLHDFGFRPVRREAPAGARVTRVWRHPGQGDLAAG